MAIRADEVRFTERDLTAAMGTAAGLGALLGGGTGALLLSDLWGLGLVIGAMVGAVVGLLAAAGGGIGYAIARSRGTHRVAVFAIVVGVGAAVLPVALLVLFLTRTVWGSDDVYRWQAIGTLAVLFAGTALLAGMFVAASFRRRAKYPAPVVDPDDVRGKYPVGPAT